MTTSTVTRIGGIVPPDIWRVRLAIIRTLMEWTYRQAGKAAGVSGEAWRKWETGETECSMQERVAARLAEETPFARRWILAGGPLGDIDPDDPLAKRLVAPAPGLEPGTLCYPAERHLSAVAA